MVYTQTYKRISLTHHRALMVIGYVTSHLTPYVTSQSQYYTI